MKKVFIKRKSQAVEHKEIFFRKKKVLNYLKAEARL